MTAPRVPHKSLLTGVWQNILRQHKTRPATSTMIEGGPYGDLSPESLQLLLNRAPRRIKNRAAARWIRGKRVLITGAGGTIGSELTRQVYDLAPSKLVLLDHAEHSLYQIDMEMHERQRKDGHKRPLHTSLLVDICNLPHLTYAFDATQPEIVLHAAACKHVPIVEQNPCVGALTNVLGTKNVFDAAINTQSEAVVFISSDKAVNPTNVMGATKRVAELYAQALDVSQGETRFVTVRFGNVLGSTGSVLPLFQRQIAMGGPITVTHPSIARFFMTSHEAVQLVIQSASLYHKEQEITAHDGRIFVLDMGEPVTIVDLAERTIKASGLTPHLDIDIMYTGLRPGEKLFEEMFLDTEQLVKTGTDGVLLASPTMIDLPLLSPRLDEVIQFARQPDLGGLYTALHHLVPEFKPKVTYPTPPAAECSF